MGKKIEFPKNYERFLLKGTELMNNGSMHEAVECFEKAYELKKEKISNTLYMSMLYETGNYNKAVEVAEDMIQTYEENEYQYIFYTTALIKAKKFLQAEAIIKKQLNENSPFYAQWTQLAHALDSEKEHLNKEIKRNEQRLLKRMYAVGDLSLEEQLFLMEEVKILPAQLQRNGCKAVLQNPFAVEIAKTAALHYLKELEEKEGVDFLWFDEMRCVRPVELYSLENHPVLNQVRTLLTTLTEKNPSLSELVLQEAELHFMQIYPFVDEVITDSEIWTQIYLKQYGAESSLPLSEEEKTPEQISMETWFSRLNSHLR